MEYSPLCVVFAVFIWTLKSSNIHQNTDQEKEDCYSVGSPISYDTLNKTLLYTSQCMHVFNSKKVDCTHSKVNCTVFSQLLYMHHITPQPVFCVFKKN